MTRQGESLGALLAETLKTVGIGGHILGCDADATTITVRRPIYDTTGRPCLFLRDDGTATEFAVVLDRIDLNLTTRGHVVRVAS